MMRSTVYLETTIISYLGARPSRNVMTASHQTLTRRWWRSRRLAYDLCVSQAVIQEASSGDSDAVKRRLSLLAGLRVLHVSPEAVELAERIVRDARLPVRAGVDALHVAIAATHGATVLLTWNCRHIAGVTCRPRIESACRAAGYEPPVICTPLEMMESDP